MRRWQVMKLREAGLDPYMRATWQEAQAVLAQQSIPAIDAPIAAAAFPPASDRTCPRCGRVCKHPQALKWHLKGCKARPEAAA
jgi:hypothetical protein